MITLPQAGLDADVPKDGPLTVAVLAAIVGAGGLEEVSVRRVLGATGAMPRYMTLEAARAATELDHTLPGWAIDRIRSHWDGPVPSSAQGSADMAIDCPDVPDAPPEFGEIANSRDLEPTALPPPSDVEDESNDDAEEPQEEDEEEPGKVAAKSHIAVAAPFSNPLTKLMKSILGGQSKSEDGGGGDTGVRSKVAPDALASKQAQVVRGTPPKRRAKTPTAIGHHYPEWDRNQSAYRPDWCRVVQYEPAARSDSDADGEVHLHERALTRNLARIMASYERHDRQRAGDALDLAALVDFEVSRCAGRSPDGRVYRERRKTATDVGVLVLLDCSGSEAEESGGERVWDRQRRLAGAILESLDKAGARSAAHGFNSLGRQVRMLRIKGFNEPLGPATEQRLLNLEPAGFTRMGAALRHATATLVRSAGTPRRLLLVISDGLPYDNDYEDLYAQSDTNKALEEAAAAGIACVCLAIGSTTSAEGLRGAWGNATYVRLPEGQLWAKPIGPAIENALWSATRTQHTTTETEKTPA